MQPAARDFLKEALEHMEAAIDLLDKCPAPPGTAEYLDLAINNLAAEIDLTGQTQLRQLRRAARLALD